MKKMKVWMTFLFLWVTLSVHPVSWRCCLFPWFKKPVKKNKDLQHRLDNNGDVELVILSATVRPVLALPAGPEAVAVNCSIKTPTLPRVNSQEIDESGWEILAVNLTENLGEEAINSKDAFRHFSSDDSLQSPVVVSRFDSEVQTERKRVIFIE
ncbi:hypothetical protein KBB68_02775 [Candidatus Babeliales bacterium]|nr:hypothetical protein [Candidatus Babeliales bacterium]